MRIQRWLAWTLLGGIAGACSNYDVPSQGELLEPCCGAPGLELGSCVPVELLSAAQSDALPVDSCPEPNTRCAPNALFQAGEPPAVCSARLFGLFEFEGRCLAECFVARPARLFTPFGSCEAPERCVPCASLEGTPLGCE